MTPRSVAIRKEVGEGAARITSLELAESGDRLRVRAVHAEAVHGLGGKGDDSARPQNGDCLP
jgi:hypothetical protein